MEQNLIKYQQLPINIQKAIEQVDIAKKIQTLGQKYGLHMDQIGLMAEEIDAVIVGETDSQELVDKIESRLSLDTERAITMTTDINIEIFAPLREAVLKLNSEQTEKPSTQSVSPEPTRDSILAEIENPTPSIHPISAVDQTVPGPARSLEIIPETANTVAHDFIGSKLTETVSLPSQKAAVTLKAPEVKPKSYAADPYREAIN